MQVEYSKGGEPRDWNSDLILQRKKKPYIRSVDKESRASWSAYPLREVP